MNFRGFTLVEMIAAIALAAVLMASVVQVVAGLPVTDSAKRSMSDALDAQSLRRLLVFDLQHAHHWEFSEHQLVLHGTAHFDSDGRRGHLPSRVAYHIVEVESVPWLVRQQTLTLERSDAQPTTELLLPGVAALNLRDEEGELQTTVPLSQLPPIVQLELVSQDPGVPLLHWQILR